MTHLTTKQIIQIVDGTLDYASQAQCTTHLAVCAQCRKEVEFEKAVAKVARRQTVVSPSKDFVRNVMGRIVPKTSATWKQKVVDNLGNVFAMCMVLAILGYAISTPSLFQAPSGSPQQNIIPKYVSDTYTKIVESLSQRTTDVTKKMVSSSTDDRTKKISLTLFSLLILIGFDRFLQRRVMGTRLRN